MIIDGQRNLSSTTIEKVAKALDLRAYEAKFFQKLVLFNQTEDLAVKSTLYEELMGFKEFRKLHELDSFQYEFYSKWYCPVIFEAVGHVDFERSSGTLAASLGISVSELESSLQLMSKLSLIEFRAGKWIKRHSSLETSPETLSLNVRNYHRVMLQQSERALDEIPINRRDFQALTLSLSERDFLDLRKLLFDFLKRMNERFGDSEKPSQIYQLNSQLFPILNLTKSQSREP